MARIWVTVAICMAIILGSFFRIGLLWIAYCLTFENAARRMAPARPLLDMTMLHPLPDKLPKDQGKRG
jgi:hypothetical protein